VTARGVKKAPAREGRHMAQAAPSILNPNARAEDRAGRDPAVDSTPIIANLESISLDRFYEMQIFAPVNFA
jgi:hypothetical protein